MTPEARPAHPWYRCRQRRPAASLAAAPCRASPAPARCPARRCAGANCCSGRARSYRRPSGSPSFQLRTTSGHLHLRDGADTTRRRRRPISAGTSFRLRRRLRRIAHLIARLQDELLHALLADPADDVLRDDELAGVEAGRRTALHLSRDVVLYRAAGRRHLRRDRGAVVGNGAALLEPGDEVEQRADDRAETRRRLLVGVVLVHGILETGIEHLAPLPQRLIADLLPRSRRAHGIRAAGRGGETGICRLVAELPSRTGLADDLLRIALAGVDGVRQQLVAVLLGGAPRLVAGADLRLRLGQSGAKVERSRRHLRGVDAIRLESILCRLPRSLELISNAGLGKAGFVFLSLGGGVILRALRCLILERLVDVLISLA